MLLIAEQCQSHMRENLPSGFLTRSDTNWPLQLQKMATSLKFHIKKRKCPIHVVKTKVLIICAGKILFSHDAAHSN